MTVTHQMWPPANSRRGIGRYTPLALVGETRYQWRNLASPATSYAHVLVDRVSPSVPVLSHASVPAPILGFKGPDTRYGLDFLESQRDRAAGADSRRRRKYQPTSPVADLLLQQYRRPPPAPDPSKPSIDLPLRVHFVIDTSQDLATSMATVSKREREQLSAIRRSANWSWELCDDPSVFRRFFHDFYTPTMIGRHGYYARTESERSAVATIFRRGPFFTLHRDGELVAGSACRWNARARRLTSRLLGLRAGAADLYRDGVLKTVYSFLIEWAVAASEVCVLDLQGCEPYLSKGTFQWKRRLASACVRAPNPLGDCTVRLTVQRDTPSLRDLLVANPLLTVADDAGLQATYFYDQQRPVRHDLSGNCQGIRGRVDLNLDNFLAPSAWR